MTRVFAAWRPMSMGVLITCMISLAPLAAAQDNYPAPIAPESTKLPFFEKVLRDEKTRLFLLAPPQQTAEQRGWCEQFLADFAAGGAVTMVEPVARSDRYGNSAFRSWQKDCPTLAMNSWQGLAPLSLYPDHPNLPLYMADGRLLDGYHFGTKNFKLYVLDADNNPDNGEEVLFYSERGYSYWEAILKAPGLKMALPPIDANWNDILPPEKAPEMSTYWGGNYKMFTPKICLATDLLRPDDPYDYATAQPAPNYNGVLRYEGKSYLFTWQPESPQWEFRLYEAVRHGQAMGETKLTCTFR